MPGPHSFAVRSNPASPIGFAGQGVVRLRGVIARRFGVRAWIRGVGTIDPDADPREFHSAVPRGEFYWPAFTRADGEQFGAVQQGPPRPRTDDHATGIEDGA